MELFSIYCAIFKKFSFITRNSNSGRPLTLFPFPSLAHVPLGFQMNKYRSVSDTQISQELIHHHHLTEFARAEHLCVQLVVKLIIYVKLAETQQCLQLNLPGSLEEIEYRKETGWKKIFFFPKIIRGLNFTNCSHLCCLWGGHVSVKKKKRQKKQTNKKRKSWIAA